jgi:Rnl2 family RNA ligase
MEQAGDLTFEKFYSIENAYREKYIDSVRRNVPGESMWVVTEKVHGANLSFMTDGSMVQVGRRTGILRPDEYKNFYNCQQIVAKHEPNMLSLCQKVKNIYPEVHQVTVFGELFGGGYPECPTTKSCKSGKLVQKGVFYALRTDFYAFDICIFEHGERRHLDHDEAAALLKQAEFIYAKELYRGTFDEVLEWSSAHKSDLTTIPGLFGLPDVLDNTREGHVLRPIETQQLNYTFVALKDKNEKFSEKDAAKAEPKQTQEVCVSDAVTAALAELSAYITQQRLDNIISHHGPEITANKHRLAGILAGDAIDDCVKDGGRSSSEISGGNQALHRAVMANCMKLIKE